MLKQSDNRTHVSIEDENMSQRNLISEGMAKVEIVFYLRGLVN
jgi:hypothetical protein